MNEQTQPNLYTDIVYNMSNVEELVKLTKTLFVEKNDIETHATESLQAMLVNLIQCTK